MQSMKSHKKWEEVRERDREKEIERGRLDYENRAHKIEPDGRVWFLARQQTSSKERTNTHNNKKTKNNNERSLLVYTLWATNIVLKIMNVNTVGELEEESNVYI